LSSKWIGRTLSISDLTVRKHRQRIYKKLGVQTAVQVASLIANLNEGRRGHEG
jgi:DNA-binding CsgD family transcriptional regulator